MKLTVGCDPEFFLHDYRSDEPIMSCGRLGGTKQEPLKISEKVSVHEDNVTAEMNMDAVEHEPGSSKFYDEALDAFGILNTYVRAKCGRNTQLLIQPEQTFSLALLKATPGAMMFGCDPDLDAYNEGARNPTFGPEEVGADRFAGGHIHLGYAVDDCIVPKTAIVKLLEALVLVPWSCKFNVIGKKRVKFYGKPGAFREKLYGLEWRTPSATWLQEQNYCTNLCDAAHWIINNPGGARMAYEQINFDHVKQFLTGELAAPLAKIVRSTMTELAKPIFAMTGIDPPKTADEYMAARVQVRNGVFENFIAQNNVVVRG